MQMIYLASVFAFLMLVTLSSAQNATMYQVIVLENYESKFFSCANKIQDLCSGNSYSLRKKKYNPYAPYSQDSSSTFNRNHLHYLDLQRNQQYSNSNNSTNTNTTKPSSSDIIKCKSATDYYQKCMVGGYEISSYKSSNYYDMNYKTFPKYLSAYSLQCEAQSLANYQNTAYGKNQIDQHHSCYNQLIHSHNDPDSTQKSISQFSKYSAACKKKYYVPCDSLCVDMYSRFEQCVQMCENNIYVTNAYYIARQVRNHITSCLTACNESYNVSRDKRTNPILQCLANNTELTNGTAISGSILQYFGFLVTMLALFIF